MAAFQKSGWMQQSPVWTVSFPAGLSSSLAMSNVNVSVGLCDRARHSAEERLPRGGNREATAMSRAPGHWSELMPNASAKLPVRIGLAHA